jgi:hypothetical protein
MALWGKYVGESGCSGSGMFIDGAGVPFDT